MSKLNIGETIVTKRKSKGITQDELASYVGVSKASVSKWETSQSYPDITFLPLLASYFNITVDELIGYEPQMVKKDILKLYHQLSNKFIENPFDEVIVLVRENIKKYYSCFPLLYQMSVLMINYFSLETKEKQHSLLREVIELLVRVKTFSDNVELCKQANCMEALCYIILEEPEHTLELLGQNNLVIESETGLLSSAYMMSGQPDKAKEVRQIGAYQTLLNLIESLTGYLQLILQNKDEFDRLLSKIMAVCNVFEIENLKPDVMLSVYVISAQGYMVQNHTEQALEMIQKYINLAVRDIYPLKLHGDSFFNQIDSWLSELDFGKEVPINAKGVYQNIISAIADNPAFTVLHDNLKYKNMVETLKTIGG